jgi:hypothetical protein
VKELNAMMEIIVCPGFPELSIHWAPHVALWAKAGIAARIIPTLELARETSTSPLQQTFEAMGKKFANIIDESSEDVHVVCGDLGALVVLGSMRFLNRPEALKKITFYNFQCRLPLNSSWVLVQLLIMQVISLKMLALKLEKIPRSTQK